MSFPTIYSSSSSRSSSANFLPDLNGSNNPPGSASTRPLAARQINLPQDALIKAFYYLPQSEMEVIAPTCREINDVVNDIRINLWQKLQFHGQIKLVIDHSARVEQAKTVKEKMRALAKVLAWPASLNRPISNPHDDRSAFLCLAEKASNSSLMSFAVYYTDIDLFESINPEIIPEEELNRISCLMIGNRSFDNHLQKLLDSNSSLMTPELFKAAMQIGRTDLVTQWLKKYQFNVDDHLKYACLNNLPHYIQMMLGSNQHYTKTYFEFAGMNETENASTGLQEALVIAVSHTRTDALKELLKAKPSIQILEHLLDLARFHQLFVEGQALFGWNVYSLLMMQGTSDNPQKQAFLDRIPQRFKGYLVIPPRAFQRDKTAIIQQIEQELKIRRDKDDEKEAPPQRTLPFLPG